MPGPWVSIPSAKERSVDLEQIERQTVQVAQGRIAGPEVVEGERHPEAPYLVKSVGVLSDVAQEERLGHLDGLERRIESGLMQGVRDPCEDGLQDRASSRGAERLVLGAGGEVYYPRITTTTSYGNWVRLDHEAAERAADPDALACRKARS